MRRPASISAASPAAVVATSPRSGTSSAVGPSSTLPYTVGATSTPLLLAVGTGSRISDSSGRASLSNTISSPRRGQMVNLSPPIIASMTSLFSPAAFTTQRQRTTPVLVTTWCSEAPDRIPVTRLRSRSRAPAASAWVA